MKSVVERPRLKLDLDLSRVPRVGDIGSKVVGPLRRHSVGFQHGAVGSWAVVSTWPFGEVIPAGFSACVPVDQDMVPWTAAELISYMFTFRYGCSSKVRCQVKSQYFPW